VFGLIIEYSSLSGAPALGSSQCAAMGLLQALLKPSGTRHY
jgi:hypothetical protein